MPQQPLTIVRRDPLTITSRAPATPAAPPGDIERAAPSPDPVTALQELSQQPSQPTPNLRLASRGLMDLLTGTGKGVARTAIGASELVNRGMSAIGLADPIRPDVFEAARTHFTSPEGVGQQVGMGVEQIAELAIPFGGGARATALMARAPRLLRGATRMAGEATELGAKAAVQSGADPDTVVASALFGAGTPAVVGAMRGVGKAVGQVLPARLYTQVFKVAHDDWLQAIRTQARGQASNPTLAREVLDRGLRGNTTNMAVYVVRKLDSLEGQVQSLVRHGMGPSGAASSTALPTIGLNKKPDVINLLKTIERTFQRSFFSERAAEAGRLWRAFQGVRGGQVRAVDALDAKRFFDKMRNTSSFRLDPTLSATQEGLKGAADLIRGTLRQDTRFAKLMDEERIMIEALDELVNHAVRTENKRLLGLTDYILGGGGMAAGWGVSGIGAAAAVRGFQQPFTLTNLGFSIDRLNKLTPSAEVLGRGVTATGASGVSR